ncbi:MAG: arylsulfotransferase family protein [Pleurocapsa sp.]
MTSSRFSLIFFILSSAFIVFNGGYLVREFKLFPYQFYTEAAKGWTEIRDRQSEKLPWYYIRMKEPPADVAADANQPQPGLTLVTKMAADRNIEAEIINLEGQTLHTWQLNWFDLWSDAQHLPDTITPKEKPGTNAHGAVIMDNGDLVFNFESLGLVRLDRKGEVVWRLPYQTHHSIHKDDNDNLWVCGKKYHTEKIARLPNLLPPFYEDTILQVTPEGKILKEYYLADILRKNGYGGLLYLGSLNNESTKIQGDGNLLSADDILHLNDVEPFSNQLEADFFQPGDVLVSLRNINTVFVFNTASEKIKFISIGQFIRQHDPDFIDGNTLSVFDNNNNHAPTKDIRQSRISIVSAPENNHQVYFQGTAEKPFFTNVMGKHQWLANGNLLITESMVGRGFEIDPQGKIVWQHINYVEPGTIGVVTEMQRLPPEYTHLFTNKQ